MPVNIASVATLIGNLQKMLIGQVLDLSFSFYFVTINPDRGLR